MLTIEECYRFHTENLRAVSDAMTQLETSAKLAIRRRDEARTLAASRVYAILVAIEAETRLLKLVHQSVVTERDRTEILSAASQHTQWLAAIDCGFRRKHIVAGSLPLGENLPLTARMRRDAIRATVDTDLRPVAELRNTLAHGQWVYAFNTKLDSINPAIMKALKTENLRTSQHRRAIVEALAYVVSDLFLASSTFERDFDTHFATMERRRRQLQHEDYEGYVQFLRRRHERRQQYR